MVMVKATKKRFPIELAFAAIALVVGVFVTLRMAPLFGNDEIVHFPRAYHVSEGHAWAEHISGYDYGGYLPEQVVDMNDSFREQVQNKQPNADKIAELKSRYAHEKQKGDERKPLAFTSAGVYSPWAYLPGAIGVGLARLLHLPLVWYVYLGRLSCFLIWLALVCWAIRLIPAGKYFLIAVALLPTSLVQAATIGMDGIVSGLAWLLVALTLAIMTKQVRLTGKILALTFLLSLYLATTKQGYALIAAIPLIIPAALYSFTKKQAHILRLAFAAALLVVTVGYIVQTAPIASILHHIQRPTVYVDSGAQLRHIMSHPLSVTLSILLAPFTLSYLVVYAGVVGVLTNRLIYLPLVVIFLLYVALTAVYVSGEGFKKLEPYKIRLLLSCLVAVYGTFTLINLALYISFTSVGNPHIEGVQGRYFLPLAPLLIGLRAGWPKPLFKFPSKANIAIGSTISLGLISTIVAIR